MVSRKVFIPIRQTRFCNALLFLRDGIVERIVAVSLLFILALSVGVVPMVQFLTLLFLETFVPYFITLLFGHVIPRPEVCEK